MSDDTPRRETVTVQRNADGTDHIHKETTGGGWCYDAALPLRSLTCAFHAHALTEIEGAAVLASTIHGRGEDERLIMLALGGESRSTVWIGAPDAAAEIVRQLQGCIARARALMTGGGTA